MQKNTERGTERDREKKKQKGRKDREGYTYTEKCRRREKN